MTNLHRSTAMPVHASLFVPSLALAWHGLGLASLAVDHSSLTLDQWTTEPDRTYRTYRTGSVSGSVRSGSAFSGNTEPDLSDQTRAPRANLSPPFT